jgi:hypothetical protein
MNNLPPPAIPEVAILRAYKMPGLVRRRTKRGVAFLVVDNVFDGFPDEAVTTSDENDFRHGGGRVRMGKEVEAGERRAQPRRIQGTAARCR